MPVATGRQRPTAHTEAASGASGVPTSWTNPARAYDPGFDDASSASQSWGPVGTNGSDGAFLRMSDLGVLAEDGGTIPTGATITRVLWEYRMQTHNGNAGLGAHIRVRITGRVKRGGNVVTGSPGVLEPPAGQNANSGIVTRSADFPGSAADPQGTFTRADFANATALEIEVFGTKIAGLTGPDAMIFVYWVAASIEWVLFEDGSGGGANPVAAAGTASALITPAGGGKAPVATGGQPRSLVSRGVTGATALAEAGGQPRPLVDRIGGAAASIVAGAPGHTIFVIRPTGAKVTAAGAEVGSTQLATLGGGGRTPATAGGFSGIQVDRDPAGAGADASGSGQPIPLVAQAGGAAAASASGDAGSSALAMLLGGGLAVAGAGAEPATVVSFAIAGYSRDGGTDAVVAAVRVDVYRTSNHEHMGRVVSSSAPEGPLGLVGYYTLAIPRTGNETATFWCRFYKVGTPNRFATTDEDLTLFSTIVQTV